MRTRTPVTRLVRVLCAGQMIAPSAPTRTLARALRPHGIRVLVRAGTAPQLSTGAFIRRALVADALLCVAYDGPSAPLIRRLALTAALGRPVLRWWVGTDVLNVLRDPVVRARAQQLDRFVTLNLAVAPHLADELASVGIRARVVPSVLAAWTSALRAETAPVGPVPRALLIYLPTARRAFYGEATISSAIDANPDIAFVVVGDTEHTLAGHPNVRSLGWVEDLRPVYAAVGGLLRLTEHDGLPRMVLESLLLGKYVIHAWPLPGCWQAQSFEELHAAIAAFRSARGPNSDGRHAALRLLDPDPAAVWADTLRNAHRTRLSWPRAAAFAAMCSSGIA